MPHFGTTLSFWSLLAKNASFHRLTHKHHLQPSVNPIDRKLLPLEVEKSKNSSVTIAVALVISRLTLSRGMHGSEG
jgi:hypothetical protein